MATRIFNSQAKFSFRHRGHHSHEKGGGPTNRPSPGGGSSRPKVARPDRPVDKLSFLYMCVLPAKSFQNLCQCVLVLILCGTSFDYPDDEMNRRIVLPSTSIGLDPVTGTMDQVLVPSDRLCDSLTHRDLSRPSLTNQSASLNGKCHSLAPRLTPRCPSVPRERLTAARLSQPMPAPRRARPSADGSRHRSRWETQRL